jgi:hypothetical protein
MSFIKCLISEEFGNYFTFICAGTFIWCHRRYYLCLSSISWCWSWSFSCRNQKTITISVTRISFCAYCCHWYWDTISISITHISNIACWWWENTFSISFLDVSVSTNKTYITFNAVSVSITLISRLTFLVSSCSFWIYRNINIFKISTVTLCRFLNWCYLYTCSNVWALSNTMSCSIWNIC